jgi:FkbM family methyltransferase
MNMSALMAAAYVEVQRTTGRKPSLTARLNRLLQRPVEPDFCGLKHFRLPAGHVCIDAGANRGESIASVRLFQSTAPIVAFEPNPLLGDVIRQRHPRDPNLTLKTVGLGDAPGQFELHVPYYKGVPFDGLASFKRDEAATFLNADRLVGFNARHLAIRTFTCAVATLDSFNLKPAFIKIDVQGLEPAVIRGGLASIAAHKPIILMENNKPESDAAQVLAMGYLPYAYRGDKLVAGTYGSLNTFYIHPQTRHLFAPDAYA